MEKITPAQSGPQTTHDEKDSLSASHLNRLGDVTGGIARFAQMWAGVLVLSAIVAMFARTNLGEQAQEAYFGLAAHWELVGPLALLCIAISLLLPKLDDARKSLRVGAALVAVLSFSHGYYNALYCFSTEAVTVRPTWNSVMLLVFPLLVIAPYRYMLATMAMPALSTSLLTGLMILTNHIEDHPHEFHEILIRLFLVQSPTLVCALMSLFGVVRLRAMNHRLANAETELGEAKQKLDEVGTYKLERKLGAGGMGEVWRATHAVLARPAAIKLVNLNDLVAKYGTEIDLSQIGARFEREAKVTARLTSPHTVRVYDYGVSKTGSLYYAMELLEGVDIDQLIERDGRQNVDRTASVILQSCDSLAEAHARGLVHRDIKPANLYLCRQGLRNDFVKVLDFGLAGIRQQDNQKQSHPKLTREGMISGTPHFMAPEQAMDTSTVDGKADVYALGCVAYNMLTGKPPFEGTSLMAVVMSHVTDTPELPSKVIGEPVHPEFEALVMRMLSKKPEDRPDAFTVGKEIFAMGFMPWPKGSVEIPSYEDAPIVSMPPVSQATLLYVDLSKDKK